MEENQRIWKVYRYTCKHNGLIYIGITSRTLDERWASGNGYKNNPRLYNTIKKYGVEGFIREILLDNLTKQEAFEKEIEYIAKFNATDPAIGFNIARGGSAPMFGRKHSEEAKKKFSETRTGKNNGFFGKHHSEETKNLLRKANTGKKHTKEWKQQQSIRSKEWHKTHENPMKGNHQFVGEKNPMYGRRGSLHPSATPVQQFTLDGIFVQEFLSTTEAAQAMGLRNGAHITECCKGKRKKCAGYVWKYKIVDMSEQEDNDETN